MSGRNRDLAAVVAVGCAMGLALTAVAALVAAVAHCRIGAGMGLLAIGGALALGALVSAAALYGIGPEYDDDDDGDGDYADGGEGEGGVGP